MFTEEEPVGGSGKGESTTKHQNQLLTSSQGVSDSPDAPTSSPAEATGASSTAKTSPEPASSASSKKRARDDDEGASSRKKLRPSACLEQAVTVGLRNALKNMCYMNSAVQILANCEPMAVHLSERREGVPALDPDLRAAVEDGSTPAKQAAAIASVTADYEEAADANLTEPCLSAELGRLVTRMRAAGGKAPLGAGMVALASTRILDGGVDVEDRRWDGKSQQDAGEYLQLVIEQVAEDERMEAVLSGGDRPETTRAQEVFEGQWKVHEVCANCKASKDSIERFTGVNVALPDLEAKQADSLYRELRRGDRQDLIQLLTDLRRPDHQRTTCGHCGQQEVEHSRTFHKLPKRLLVSVSRTGYDRSGVYKKTTELAVPIEELLLSDAGGRRHFRLEAAAEHTGQR